MKKTLLSVLALLILGTFISGCALTPSSNAPVRTMEVNGTGTVELEPDIAHVNIGVRSQAPEIADALDQNNASAEAIIESLVDLGVNESDIQTRNFNIYPQQEQPRPMMEFDIEEVPQESLTTFVVENTVSVTVRELGSLGEILSRVIAEGANTIYGVTFDIENREEAVAEARKLAIEDAKEQAQTIASAAGIDLGPIHSINISKNGAVPMERAVAMEAAQGGSVPISEGSLTIRVNAYITFEID